MRDGGECEGWGWERERMLLGTVTFTVQWELLQGNSKLELRQTAPALRSTHIWFLEQRPNAGFLEQPPKAKGTRLFITETLNFRPHHQVAKQPTPTEFVANRDRLSQL